MSEKIEISPTRWSQIKMLIIAMLFTPVMATLAWLEGLPTFIRLGGAFGFFLFLFLIPVSILCIVTLPLENGSLAEV
jgi:hypothetical protein